MLDSPVFAAQQRLAGRKAPNNAVVRAALKALDGQQDGLSRRMLGQVLGLAELQVRGLLAGLQRLLNVDGYQVIVVDEASGIVTISHKQAQTADVLRRLIEDGVTECNQIAQEMKVSPATVSRFAKKAIDAGWLRKVKREYVLAEGEK